MHGVEGRLKRTYSSHRLMKIFSRFLKKAHSNYITRSISNKIKHNEIYLTINIYYSNLKKFIAPTRFIIKLHLNYANYLISGGKNYLIMSNILSIGL